MNRSRQSGMSGPNPLSLTDIANWSVLTGNILYRDEITTIRAMDAVFVAEVAKEQAEAAERNKPTEGT
ncbi:MAG: hypothetical protein PS018_00560 [bacterium]|nr:hypothetical protein [bacterium]